MKKAVCAWLCAALVLSAAACASATRVSVYGADDTWAIYWYLCGSDLESDSGAATDDLAELAAVSLPENVRVVIEAGGAREWQNDFDPEKLSRYLYDRDGLRLLETVPGASMGDGQTLADFLSFCNENYPADHRAVVFWNHGGGSVNGIAFDELYEYDALDMGELRAAFGAVTPPDKKNPPYEMIGFDACLMATIDVAETLNGFTRWMVASEESEPGYGWEYESAVRALAENPGMNGGELGLAICDGFLAACEEYGVDETSTLSVIDMSRADELLDAYYDAGTEALLYLAEGEIEFREIARAALRTVNYGNNNRSAGYDNMIDLGDFMSRIAGMLPVTGERVSEALNNAVFYAVNGELQQGSTGLSFYYSYDFEAYKLDRFREVLGENPYIYLYEYAMAGELSYRGLNWLRSRADRFPEAATVTPKRYAFNRSAEFEGYPVETDAENHMVLTLEPGPAREITDIYLALEIAGADGPVYLGQCNDLDADWETGVFTEKFRGVWGSLDGELAYMYVDDETDDYVIYDVPIRLNGIRHTLAVSYTYATGEYKILNAREGLSAAGMAPKKTIRLKPGDRVRLLHYAEMTEKAADMLVAHLRPELEANEEVSQMSPEEREQWIADQIESAEAEALGSLGSFDFVDGSEIIVNRDTRFSETKLDGPFALTFEMIDILNVPAYSLGVTVGE